MKATDNPFVRQTIRAMWGRRLKEIAQATGLSISWVSIIAGRLELPSRKHVVRTAGLRITERDRRLQSVWNLDTMSDSEKASYVGFTTVYSLRRRAQQLGLGYRPTRHGRQAA